MLKSILVPLDSSPFSASAVELGLRWAKRFDCRLAAVGVIDEPTLRGPQSVPIGGGAFKVDLDDSRMATATQHIERLLSRFAVRCSEAGVSSKVLEDVGHPWKEILREAQRFDLIVMGQEASVATDIERTTQETLEHVLHNSPRPVVATPETLGQGSGVVVAFDGSVQASRALQAFLGSGLAEPGPVHVLTVHSNSSVEAAKVADRAVEYLAQHDVRAKPRAVVGKRPTDIVLQEARELAVELVVMGAHSKSKWREFLLGSVTCRMLRDSELPLFLYH